MDEIMETLAGVTAQVNERVSDPSVRTVVGWASDDGSTSTWAFATTDNRPGRIAARMARYGIVPMPGTLVVRHIR